MHLYQIMATQTSTSLENRDTAAYTRSFGVVSKGSKGVFPGAANVIQHQVDRPPIGVKTFPYMVNSEGTPALGVPIRFRLPKRNFIPNQSAYIRLTFDSVPVVAGGATQVANYVQGYNMINTGSNAIQLLYSQNPIATLKPEQVMYETKFFQTQQEKYLTQKLGNEGLRATQVANAAVAGKAVYIPLLEFLSDNIQLPLSAYPADFYLEVTLDRLNRLVQGDDAANTLTNTDGLKTAELIIHGTDVPLQAATESIFKIASGLEYYTHNVTSVTKTLTGNATAKQFTFTFDNIKGSVSNIVFYFLDNAAFISTTAGILNKELFSTDTQLKLSDANVQLGTSIEPNLYTGRNQYLEMIRYKSSARESGCLYSTYDDAAKPQDVPIYTMSFSQFEQFDISSGQSSGSVRFDGTEQIVFNFETPPTAFTNRLVMLIYRPSAQMIKGNKIGKRDVK